MCMCVPVGAVAELQCEQHKLKKKNIKNAFFHVAGSKLLHTVPATDCATFKPLIFLFFLISSNIQKSLQAFAPRLDYQLCKIGNGLI